METEIFFKNGMDRQISEATAMAFVLDFRSHGRNGNYLLVLSISHFDPTRTSATGSAAMARPPHLIPLQ
jgi:hypothetical protein